MLGKELLLFEILLIAIEIKFMVFDDLRQREQKSRSGGSPLIGSF